MSGREMPDSAADTSPTLPLWTSTPTTGDSASEQTMSAMPETTFHITAVLAASSMRSRPVMSAASMPDSERRIPTHHRSS
jgi:hypothetical protein